MARPLRFCMVTTFYPPYHFGGDAIAVSRLVHALARRGHQVHVIHNVDAFKMLSGKRLSDQDNDEPFGVTTHKLQSRFSSLACLATQQSGRPSLYGPRIRQILRDNEFDVIHFHNISLAGGPGVLSYGSGVKLYSAHEHWLICPTHVLWRHNRELCTSRQCLRCTLHYRRPPQLWRYTGWLEQQAQHIDAFISPSRFTAGIHSEFGFERPFEVIPHFLPRDVHDHFPVDECGRTNRGRPYFLFVGRLEKLKGLQDVIPHFDGDLAADLLVAGEGNYEDSLRATADALPRVRFLGVRTPEQLRELYQNAIAVVVPSLTFETFGLVILEALRERTPVIARALGPLKEIVEDSKGGLLFNNADELGQALRRLANDPLLRNSLGSSGFQYFQQQWTEEIVIGKYLRLIEEIARRQGYNEMANVVGEHDRSSAIETAKGQNVTSSSV